MRRALAAAETRAARRGITVVSRIPDHVEVETKPTAASVLVPILVDDAIASASMTSFSTL